MKTLLMLLISSLLLISIGCKKRTDVVPSPSSPVINAVSCPESRAYFPLSKGSYWVYEIGEYHTLNNTSGVLYLDSCYILEKDSVVDNKKYSVMARVLIVNNMPHPPRYILYRYESNYVIAHTDKDYKFFSYCSTGSVLHKDSVPEIWYSEFQVLNKDSSVTVPAGTFETRSTENKYTVLLEYPGEPNNERIQNTYYSKNVGLVYDREPYSSTTKVYRETKLVRYAIAGN